MADSFFVENIFEELDADNEFFYDAKTSTLCVTTPYHALRMLTLGMLCA